MTGNPRCLCCNKAIRKSTDIIYAPREHKDYAIPEKDWKYTGNKIVVASRYSVVDPKNRTFVDAADNPDGEKRLYCVHVWDGETYLAEYRYFCSKQCAARYGQQAGDAVAKTLREL